MLAPLGLRLDLRRRLPSAKALALLVADYRRRLKRATAAQRVHVLTVLAFLEVQDGSPRTAPALDALLEAKNFEAAAQVATLLSQQATAVQDRPTELRQIAGRGLKQLCDHPKLVDWLVVWTRTAGGEAIVRAAQILSFLGASALPRLLQEQSHQSAEVRDRSTSVLITMADQAFPVLLNELASKHLTMDEMIIVIVGDKAVILPQIQELGYEIVELDAEGNELPI